jgi:hypothetical protein
LQDALLVFSFWFENTPSGNPDLENVMENLGRLIAQSYRHDSIADSISNEKRRKPCFPIDTLSDQGCQMVSFHPKFWYILEWKIFNNFYVLLVYSLSGHLLN